MNSTMKEFVGSMHIHSTYSDGTLEIPDICREAEAAGLEYIMMTDHNTLQPVRDGFEGWNDSLMVIIGCELNDNKNRNHYLVFNYNKELPNSKDALKYVRQVTEAGGLGIIAHPDEDGGYIHNIGSYPWTDWRINEFQGMELWNQMTEWKEGLTPNNKFWRLIHPRRYIRGPKHSTMARWDYLIQQRKVIGTGGPDAHAFRYKVFGFIPVCIYPYKVNFKLIRMHILVPDELKNLAVPGDQNSFHKTKDALLSNLSYGRAFISNYYLGEARGFRLSVDTPAGILGMGDQMDWNGMPCKMDVSCPSKGLIKLIRNGKAFAVEESDSASFAIREHGVYRIEVYRDNKCWIISNPVWLQAWPGENSKGNPGN